jgi:hypothetical protein
MALIQEVQEFQEQHRVLKIACAMCRRWIANAQVKELDIPLKGSMFQRRVGCDHWIMPEPDATGKGLVCPMSEGGDAHLFIPHIPGREEEANTLVIDGQAEQYTVRAQPKVEEGIKLCPCGCGREPILEHSSGNVYATAQCHTRWVFKQPGKKDRS